jgi:hypothetical protein
MCTFEANGKTYKTDIQTLNLLREYKDNPEMRGAVFELGLEFGRIKEA